MLHAECAHWSSQVTAGPPSFPFAAKSWHTYVPPFDPLFPQHPSLNTVFCTARRPPSPSIPLPAHPTHSPSSLEIYYLSPRKEKACEKGGQADGEKGENLLRFCPPSSLFYSPSPLPHLLDLPRSLLADFLLSDFGRHRRLLELEELCPSAASGRPPCFLAPFTFLRPKPAGNMTGGGGRRYCSRLSREGNRWERLF